MILSIADVLIILLVTYFSNFNYLTIGINVLILVCGATGINLYKKYGGYWHYIVVFVNTVLIYVLIVSGNKFSPGWLMSYTLLTASFFLLAESWMKWLVLIVLTIIVFIGQYQIGYPYEVSVVFSFSLFIGGMLLERSYKYLVVQQNKIYNQKIKIESAHTEIKDSINYAKRIQEAILPPLSQIKETLPQSFVLYQPKDVVAGDFYWMEATSSVSSKGGETSPLGRSGGTIYIAAADCTGHGVPGAMVSVVCSAALTKAVLEDGIRDVGNILDRTREIVIDKLAKSSEMKDGMDISLACVDFDKMKLEWAGANNPLYFLRRSEGNTGTESKEIENTSFRADAGGVESEFSIEITKGDREPIGFTDQPTPFTKHEFELQKGDTIYLFTDGYADQFGGPEGRKIGYKRFREKLLEVSNLEMEKQKVALEQYFEEWKEREEQVDDVCVIGIKI